MSDFELPGVLPWGRRLFEYRAYFGLPDRLAGLRIADVAGGPASFAAEARAEGAAVISVDPLYDQNPDDIAAGFEDTTRQMRRGLTEAAYRFRWNFYGSVDRLLALRREAHDLFLADYTVNRSAYVPGLLPDLPLPDDTYDLALCSHFLFLYGDHLSLDFHVAAIREMARIAREVRIFPLINLDGRPSAHLCTVRSRLMAEGLRLDLVDVDFEFQVGATKYLRIGRTD